MRRTSLIIFTILITTISVNPSGNPTNIDKNYEIIWEKLWGIEYENDMGANQVAIDANNNIFVIINNASQGLILMYNENGNLLAEHKISYDYLNKQEIIDIDEYVSIPFDRIAIFLEKMFMLFDSGKIKLRDIEINQATSELFVLGYFESKEGNYRTFVTKYTISGNSINEVWTKVIGYKNLLVSNAFTIDSSSNIYIPLIFPDSLMKLSSDGEIIYVKFFNFPKYLFMTDIEINPITKNIIITAQRPRILNPQQSEFIIIEVNPVNGNKINKQQVKAPLQYGLNLGFQSIAFLPDGDFFASTCFSESGYKSKLIKLDRNLNILLEKTLSHVITDMVIMDNELITTGALISLNGTLHYGSVVYSVDGTQLFIADLGPIINSFNPFSTNRMKAIKIDNNNDLVTVGGEGSHSSSLGYVSAVKTIKFRILNIENSCIKNHVENSVDALNSLPFEPDTILSYLIYILFPNFIYIYYMLICE